MRHMLDRMPQQPSIIEADVRRSASIILMGKIS